MVMYPLIENIDIPQHVDHVEEVKLKFHLIESHEIIEND